ncbi:MAG: hypothetical protein IK118_05900 [Clostridia bacterium]|nr:hypothetical protein [Clostridia bacterium]MBR5427863.1 hypothetical protein [Clostridia bacterium]
MRFQQIVTVFKEKKLLLIIALGSLGVIMLLFSELGEYTKARQPATDEKADAEKYTAYAEEKLTALITQIRGAGKAKVMITLESTGESYYAFDTESESSTGEKTAQQSEQSKVAAASDGGLKTSQREPEIRGVAVICEGAGSDEVKREVTETVRAALGVSRDRIYVAQMQKKE